MKLLMLGVLAAATVLGGSKIAESEKSGGSAPAKGTLHLTFNDMALDRAFHGNFNIQANSTSTFTMPNDQGFVLRQMNIPPNPNSLAFTLAVDGPADTAVNPLAFTFHTGSGSGGTVTIDPPLVVPPNSVLSISLGNYSFGPFNVGIHGYSINANEL